VRAIHPSIGIDSLPAVNHQPEFAAHCITEAADRAVVADALALAWTAIDAAGAGTPDSVKSHRCLLTGIAEERCVGPRYAGALE
jgi:hypothetical protein